MPFFSWFSFKNIPLPQGNDVFSASVRSVHVIEELKKDLTQIYEMNDLLETYPENRTQE
jgi:hypothetical protein